MGRVILGLEHVFTGSWKHETHQLMGTPGAIYQGQHQVPAFCMIYFVSTEHAGLVIHVTAGEFLILFSIFFPAEFGR